ncbi:MAG: DEAD/DEAH box helicase [Planctomycetaceae bacterium]
MTTTFQELNLIAPVQRAITEEKYETPTPIQAQTIPHVLTGRDVLGCAQTGTGKTAAFALPILNKLGEVNRRSTPNRPRVLVLAPTRELAVQIGDSFSTYGRHLRLRHALVYGGVGQYKQVSALNKGVHILVATPGRLLDLMNQGHIELDQLEIFVLDEADRMMDMGFLPDLKRIISALPAKRQSLFFSATLAPKIRDLAGELLTDPISVSITPEVTNVERIEQRVLHVERGEKMTLLKSVLNSEGVGQTLVFTRTKRGANRVAELLSTYGVNSTAIHGNKSQAAREKALGLFRNGRVRVLVATDLAARGIDVDGITHVINFELPNEPESYVHRIGRTGRAGASGIALTFCSSAERGELRAIERFIGQPITIEGEGPKPFAGNKEGDADGTQPRNRRPKRRFRRGGPKPDGRGPKPKFAFNGHGKPRGENGGGNPQGRRPKRKGKRQRRPAGAAAQ